MAKRRFLTVLFLVLALICSALVLASCGDETEGADNGGNEVKKLDAPVVTLKENTATWSAIPNAEKLEISVNGALSFLESTVTSYKLGNGQTFKIRAVGDETNYETSDWSNSVTYTEITIVTYTVTWKNGDVVLELDENVSMGATPSYDGEVPTKAADEQYTYIFKGWSPEVSAVMGNITYVAQFEAVPIEEGEKTYTVTWKNGDTVLETDENVAKGTMPSYDGAEPTKAADEQYTYTFKGWSPEVSAVTDDVTYVAEFEKTIRQYTVTFYSEDGKTVLGTSTVNYGDAAVYTGSDPYKNATAIATYIFSGWVTEVGGTVQDDLSNVISNRDVYASFKEIIKKVSVYIVSSNNDYGTVSVSVINNVEIGTKISVNGNTVAIGESVVTAQENESTAKYSYAFTGWSTEESVGSDTIITANFVRNVNEYKVTWKNGEEVLETDTVGYGTVPTYNGKTPTKESSDDYSYIFSGWSPAVVAVTGDAVYVAQFTEASNKVTVTFYDEDGITVLGVAVVNIGDDAAYPNQLPTKESTKENVYTFDKWVTEKDGTAEANLNNVTQNTNVYASYKTAARKYTVTFTDWDGRIFETQEVEYGKSAVPFGSPERDGYRFDGWNKPLDAITDDTTITATYVKQYEVRFVDYDGSIIYSELVDAESDFTNIPQGPNRQDYVFVGWSETDFKNIMSDRIVYAMYEKTYIVQFVDYDGRIIKTEYVPNGSDASAPNDPTREGYDFVGWDKAFENVIEDLNVYPKYEIKKYTVTFVGPQGKILLKVEDVKHGRSVIKPTVSETYFDWEIKEGYRFTGWSDDCSSVTSDMTVNAKYEEKITDPIIVVKSVEVPKGTTNVPVKVYICCEETLFGMSLNMSFDKVLQLGGAVSVDVYSKFGVADADYTSKLTDEGKYELRWTDGNGVDPNEFEGGPIPVLTFNFNLYEYQSVGDYLIEILEDAYIINKDFVKVTPVVISGVVSLVE